MVDSETRFGRFKADLQKKQLEFKDV